MQSNSYGYRKLDVWQQSQALAAEVIVRLRKVTRDPASTEIVKQLVRAVGSVPANISEGHGRYSLGAYRNHLLIARGSVCEVGSWLDLLARCDYLAQSEANDLIAKADSVVAILTTKVRSLQRQTSLKGSRAA